MHLPKLSQMKSMHECFCLVGAQRRGFKNHCVIFSPGTTLVRARSSKFTSTRLNEIAYYYFFEFRYLNFEIILPVLRFLFSLFPIHLFHKIHHKLHIFNGDTGYKSVTQVEDPFGFLFVKRNESVQLLLYGFLVGEKDAGVQVAL